MLVEDRLAATALRAREQIQDAVVAATPLRHRIEKSYEDGVQVLDAMIRQMWPSLAEGLRMSITFDVLRWEDLTELECAWVRDYIPPSAADDWHPERVLLPTRQAIAEQERTALGRLAAEISEIAWLAGPDDAGMPGAPDRFAPGAILSQHHELFRLERSRGAPFGGDARWPSQDRYARVLTRWSARMDFTLAGFALADHSRQRPLGYLLLLFEGDSGAFDHLRVAPTHLLHLQSSLARALSSLKRSG